MDGYVAALLASTPPLPIWALALLWAVLLSCSYALLSRSQRLRTAQSLVFFPAGLEVRPSPLLFASRAVVATAVFVSAWLLGAWASVFLAGGWCIAAAVAMTSNLRSVLYFRSLSVPDGASGRIEYSAPLARRNQGAELSAAALLSLLVGLLLPHLALLGAAFFLAAGAPGCFRKARALSRL